MDKEGSWGDRFRRLTALVVDDSMTVRNYVASVLRSLEFGTVVQAADGHKAMTVLKNTRIDLVVADWNLPEVNGLDLLKWVRARDATRDLPFLMITAESSQERVFLALEARVSEYIVKPFSAATVAEKVCKMLKPGPP